jgi:membrane-associated protease RseP (regulator of RpoE activity)
LNDIQGTVSVTASPIGSGEPGTVEESAQEAPPLQKSQETGSLSKYGLPLLLLVISIITTTAIGARFMQNFNEGLPAVARDGDLWPWSWLLADPSRFFLGWPFSLSLLSILLAHEFGHYFACRYHGIRATLPWVLPAPTLSGTAGAVIQIRSPIPSRRALMDVGAFGPLAGYLVALAVAAIGFYKSHPGKPSPAIIHFGEPLTLHVIHRTLLAFRPETPSFEAALRHPILIAGWVGLFVTALNLIPAGQLDGGHILYALSPRLHKWATRIIPAVLLVCGFFYWVGWVLWAFLLLIPAMRHPRVPADQPLDRKRIFLSVLCLAIFLLTFAQEPFRDSSIHHYIHWPAEQNKRPAQSHP